MHTQDDLRAQIARSMVLMSAIGVDMAVVLGTGVFLGHLVDTRAGTGPWGLLVGIVLGLTSGLFSAFRLIQRYVH
jgi:ATP synthase protein I